MMHHNCSSSGLTLQTGMSRNSSYRLPGKPASLRHLHWREWEMKLSGPLAWERVSEPLRLTSYSHRSILSKTWVTFPELRQTPEKRIQTDGHLLPNNFFSISCAAGFFFCFLLLCHTCLHFFFDTTQLSLRLFKGLSIDIINATSNISIYLLFIFSIWLFH